jgi:hypothetical protein
VEADRQMFVTASELCRNGLHRDPGGGYPLERAMDIARADPLVTSRRAEVVVMQLAHASPKSSSGSRPRPRKARICAMASVWQAATRRLRARSATKAGISVRSAWAITASRIASSTLRQRAPTDRVFPTQLNSIHQWILHGFCMVMLMPLSILLLQLRFLPI